MISNAEFLKTLFGVNADYAHVTCFPDDPADIQDDRRFMCWGGNYAHLYRMQPNTNQYFTISIFNPDDTGKARRRKALFLATYVIVADDVVEKLPEENVLRLPAPTYKLETSPGSQQWGWVLDQPCADRHRVENLLDGLVAKGLAPEGKDPGMKGVTRYVRLPEGVNTKASRVTANGGVAPGCKMLEWNPSVRVSIDDLANPFSVDLDAIRREQRVDGAADLPDHPLLGIPDTVKVKEVRSDGRFDVTCPWVDGHTKGADDGAAIFTNNDGSIGFKCHHGTCQSRTGRDLLDLIEQRHQGFRARLESWKIMRVFGTLPEPTKLPDFMGTEAPAPPPLDFMGAVEDLEPEAEMVDYQALVDALKVHHCSTPQAVDMAKKILEVIDPLDYAQRIHWWDLIRDHMGWSRGDFLQVLKMIRKKKHQGPELDISFYEQFVYVAEQNMFYHPTKRMWLTAEGFQNTHGHIDEEARMMALIQGKVDKVDRLDYAPGMPMIYVEHGVRYVNGWSGQIHEGVQGAVDRWLDHFKALGWGEHRKHILQWMAFTLRHPERKINHILLLGGGEGNGKDFLLYPLMQAMGQDSTTIDGDELLRDFNDYLLSTKYLHVNESELGDRKEARAVANKLKPLGSAPPNHLRVNPKGIKPILIRNVVNTSMTSNSVTPVSLSGDARRYYAVWTDVTIRDESGQVTPEWRAYWDDRWKWIRDQEGWKACVYYLMTQVDLSDFDPGSVPMVTDFVKDIQEASEDPLTTIIKDLITKRLSLMAADIVSTSDIQTSLKAAQMLGHHLKNIPPTTVIGKVMKQNALGVKARAWGGGVDARLWIIRDHNKYTCLEGGDLGKMYQKQMQEVMGASKLQLVHDSAEAGG
jgi:hypothetical protein